MKKVLIVDDAMFMRLALKTIINKLGKYEIVGEAATGLEAIEKYKQLKPDIVTMDITMPDMDGLQALKSIRQFDPKATVVMITALGQESMVKEAILSGAKNFIVKPFKDDFIIKTFEKL